MIRIERLIETLGIKDQVTFSNLMAPQWKLDFRSTEWLEPAVANLRAARNVTRDAEVFGVSVEGRSVCLGAHRNQEMTDTLELPTASGVKRLPAGELLDRHTEVVKSGRHHPKGVLIMHGPDVRADTELPPCDNLDVAPTLLRLLGVTLPAELRGRALLEGLRVPQGAREPAGVR